MSEIVEKPVTCPKCSQITTLPLVCSVNTEADPEIREKIFDESFFKWNCKKCGFHSRLLHPLLYNDMKNKFMVYYIPNVTRRQTIDEKLEFEFSDMEYITKRIVPTVNAMKEKIVILEQKLDDMAVELTKTAVADVVAKSTSQSVHDGYFTDLSEDENSMTFQFFVGIDHRPYLQTIRLEVYHRSLGIVKKYFSGEKKKGGFLNIDQVWSKAALEKYRSAE